MIITTCLSISDKTYLYNVGHKIQDIKMFLWRVLKDKGLKIRSFLADLSNVHQDERQRIFNGTSVDTTWASVDTLSQNSPEDVLGRPLVSTLLGLVLITSMTVEHAQARDMQRTIQNLTQAILQATQGGGNRGAGELHRNFWNMDPPRFEGSCGGKDSIS
ncbi:hypothetical protein Taro_054741 [Colocasia esculenta]|uniref:Uncharacterized protein n=1 Tax=Colocasia esculenta TaxID=4460 RepID=A0A843XS53_COLES|nr:hypothetical protein [Colocasia esculenta]